MAPPPKPVPPTFKPTIPTRQQLALNQTRMEKRDRANMKLNIFQTEVSRRALSWKIAARMVGEAYKIADNMYKRTLSEKATSDALEIQIIFSVLTVATSGVLGWMSAAAASKTKDGVQTALADAVESSIQATAGEVFSADSPLLFPPRGDDTVSQDPQVFQDELENNVDTVHMDALTAFGKIRNWYLTAPIETWDKYDETQEMAIHREWMRKADDLAGKDALPSVDWMAKEIERGRWARYVLDSHSYRDFGIYQTADTPDDVGGDVCERLLKLGIWAAQTPWEGHGKTRASELWNWAKNYKVKSFIEEKKHPTSAGLSF